MGLLRIVPDAPRSRSVDAEVRRILRRHRARPFVELSLTLLEFCRQLHGEVERRQLDQLLFLSREGRILRRAYELYQQRVTPDRLVTTRYLYVSRRSTFIASLRPLDDEDFSRILELYPRLTNRDLLASLGFDDGDVQAVLAELDRAPDDALAVPALRASPAFRSRYEQRRTGQRALLLRYLEQVTGSPDGPLHVVDVGWKGTMQDHLQAAVGPERPVEGFYLGLVPSKGLRDGERKHGLLFDTRGDGTPMHRVFRHFKSLYELLLQADHGSVQAYRDRGGSVEPVLDVQPVEAQVFRESIGPVQAGVLAAFDELCGLYAECPAWVADPVRLTARHHARPLFFPTAAELEVVLRLQHFENFGQMGYVTPAVEPVTGVRRRLRSLLVVARQPRRLLGGTWPPLELEALGLRAVIPALGSYRYARELLVPRLTSAAATRR